MRVSGHRGSMDVHSDQIIDVQASTAEQEREVAARAPGGQRVRLLTDCKRFHRTPRARLRRQGSA